MVYKYVSAEVEVDLSEFDTEDLIEELETRNYDYNTKGVNADEMRNVLEKIWQNRRVGLPYDNELDTLIYGVLGKVI